MGNRGAPVTVSSRLREPGQVRCLHLLDEETAVGDKGGNVAREVAAREDPVRDGLRGRRLAPRPSNPGMVVRGSTPRPALMALAPTKALDVVPGRGLVAEVALVDLCLRLSGDHS